MHSRRHQHVRVHLPLIESTRMQKTLRTAKLLRTTTQAKGAGLRSAKVRKQASHQRGYALLELSIAIIISSIISLYTITSLLQQSDDASAAATGQYLDNLAQGSQRYILTNFAALADGTDVAGVANDLAPTTAELIALGRLSNTFPLTAPRGQATTVRLTRTSCPGLSCQVTVLACLTAPMSLRGKLREDLTTTAVLAMGGRGARSYAEAPAVVRGPNLSAANPIGATAGIVCGSSLVDAGIYDTFVKIGDTRDPGLRGGLTVTGTNATGEAMRASGDLAIVDPATGNICVQILRGGTINVNCAGQLNATTGTFTGPIGSVKVGGTGTTYTVDTAGRIRAETGFWTAVGSVFGDNTLGIRATGTVFTIQTGAGVDALAVHDSGRVGARTSVATAVLGLTDPVSAGDACTSAATQVTATQVTVAASTALRALAGGGLAICDPATGTWLAVSKSASAGAACTTSGTTAINSTGVMLVCANGSWSSIMDRMGYLVAAESWRVVDGSVVAKPPCAPGSTGSRLVVTAGNEQQNIQRLNRYVVDNGGSWTVRMTDGNGATISGDLLAMSYCTY